MPWIAAAAIACLVLVGIVVAAITGGGHSGHHLFGMETLYSTADVSGHTSDCHGTGGYDDVWPARE